jgi:hypothetical protein
MKVPVLLGMAMVSESDVYSIQSEWIGFLDKKKCLVSIWIKSGKKKIHGYG